MSSAALLLKPSSFGSARRSGPMGLSCSADTNSSQTSLWRPWLSSCTIQPEQQRSQNPQTCPNSRLAVHDCFSSDGKPQAFQHPVRLFWPKSKSFDYLYSDGEALLRNFPVQATISFYEESDSEDEDEDDWERDGDFEECFKPSYLTPNN